MLGYWVPLYRKLALDPDRTVRTASNAVLLDFVRVAKRNLAPVLKRCAIVGSRVVRPLRRAAILPNLDDAQR